LKWHPREDVEDTMQGIGVEEKGESGSGEIRRHGDTGLTAADIDAEMSNRTRKRRNKRRVKRNP
jgi:hypothetical protein